MDAMADAASGSHAHFDDHEYTMSHMVASEVGIITGIASVFWRGTALARRMS